VIPQLLEMLHISGIITIDAMVQKEIADLIRQQGAIMCWHLRQIKALYAQVSDSLSKPRTRIL